MAINGALIWLAGNGHNLVGLNDNDTRALEAVDACWALYWGTEDPEARRATWQAVLALLQVLAKDAWPLAIDLVGRYAPGRASWVHDQLARFWTAPSDRRYLGSR